MYSRRNFLFFVLPIFIFSFAVSVSAAYPIESIGIDPNKQDFVVGPGKQEFFLKPGEKAQTEIIVSNRTGETREFELNTEDFSGTRDLTNTVVFLGDQKGPFSLKEYIKVASKKFTLPNGTRARIPVTVEIPANAEPGGLYGSLLVSTTGVTEKTEGEGARGGVPLVTRSGVLFFVRVEGDAKEDGRLSDFSILNNKSVFSGNEDIRFQLVFENNGSVHLDPSGILSIKNMMGEEVKNIELEPWYSMPDSLRAREAVVNSKMMMGRYTATVNVYRGYGDVSSQSSFDERAVTFWVIPFNSIIILIVAVFVLVVAFRWIRNNFEFRRK